MTMRKAGPGILSTIVAVLLLAFPAHAESPDDAKVAAINRTLDSLHAAAAKADGTAYFELFAPDAIFIGTDPSERWTIDTFRTYALPIFAAGKSWTYVPRSRHVTLAQVPCGCLAWFDEILDSAHYGTSRGTGVLTLTKSGWKIEQYALTFPIPNDLAADMTGKIKAFEAHGK